VIVLRPAVADDLDAIVAIERASFSDPWSRGAFLSLVRRADAHVVVAVPDPAGGAGTPPVLGYAVAWFIVGEGEVGNVAVHPDARGRGIGARLLDAALAEAGRRGVETVFLEVRESNDAARRLYGSRGFVEVGRRKRYYRRPDEDALVMRWDGGSPA
jgi:[ribosomal protein S18]-alanine N-acetyltransferase